MATARSNPLSFTTVLQKPCSNLYVTSQRLLPYFIHSKISSKTSLVLSTQTVYLHAAKACFNVIGQYYPNNKQTTNRKQKNSNTQMLCCFRQILHSYTAWFHCSVPSHCRAKRTKTQAPAKDLQHVSQWELKGSHNLTF